MLLPPRSTLFPYTTLFRSDDVHGRGQHRIDARAEPRELLGRERTTRRARHHQDAKVAEVLVPAADLEHVAGDRKSTRLNSSHPSISYAVFCLKKKRHLQPT